MKKHISKFFLSVCLFGINPFSAMSQHVHTITVRKKVEEDSLIRANTRFLAPLGGNDRAKKEPKIRQKLHIAELYPDSTALNNLKQLPKTQISYDIRLITLYKDQPPRFWEKIDPEFKIEQLPSLGARSTDSLLLVEYTQILGRLRNSERVYLQPFAIQTYGRAFWQKIKLKSIYNNQKGLLPIPAKHDIVRYQLVMKNAKNDIVYQATYANDEFDLAIIPDFVTVVEFVQIEALKSLPKNKMKERSVLLSNLSIDAETLRRR